MTTPHRKTMELYTRSEGLNAVQASWALKRAFVSFTAVSPVVDRVVAAALDAVSGNYYALGTLAEALNSVQRRPGFKYHRDGVTVILPRGGGEIEVVRADGRYFVRVYFGPKGSNVRARLIRCAWLDSRILFKEVLVPPQRAQQ